MATGLDVVEGHDVAGVAGEIEALLDPARSRIDQRDRKAASAGCEHGDVSGGLGEGNAARAPCQRAVGIEGDAILRACGRHRHRAFGRGNLRLRQQPSRQHGFGQWHRHRETAGRAQHAKTFSETGAGAAKFLRHPRQRQAGLGQRLPQRRFPASVLVIVDGLGVGEIGENPFRGLGNNVLTLHSVPRFALSAHLIRRLRRAWGAAFVFGCMMGKSTSDDKRRCPQGGLRQRHDWVSGANYSARWTTPTCSQLASRYGRSPSRQRGRTIKKECRCPRTAKTVCV